MMRAGILIGESILLKSFGLLGKLLILCLKVYCKVKSLHILLGNELTIYHLSLTSIGQVISSFASVFSSEK